METKTFSTNSFIYRFLAWPENFLPRRSRPEDICDLRRAVISKAFFCLLLTSAAFMCIYCIASAGLFGLSKFSTFFSAYAVRTPFVLMGIVLSFAIALTSGIVCLVVGVLRFAGWFANYRAKRNYEREEAGLKPIFYPVTNPVKELYTSWKDKLCYRVSFE